MRFWHVAPVLVIVTATFSLIVLLAKNDLRLRAYSWLGKCNCPVKMSDSDSDSKIPSREVCEERCKEFADVTGTDTALAMCYLQDHHWLLERALNAFFESGGTPSVVLPSGKDLTSVSLKSSSATSSASCSKPLTESSSKHTAMATDPEPHRIRILSWNIDGIDQTNLESRSKAVCDVISKEKPDVVYLQEVIPQSQAIIEEKCPQYQVVPSGDSSYYTAMLLRCDTVVYTDHAITPFYTSKMGRNLLHVKARVKGVEMLLMTSHLESTKSHAAERKRQLQASFKSISEAPASKTVLFGGDLNLRDDEVAALGGLPDDLYDIWEVTGKRPEAKFTWDCTRNDNLECTGYKFKPKARFDRLYMRHSSPTKSLKPVYFELVGIERLTSCQRFASDHWGILSHYDKV